jgi:hypothetical protein
MNQDRHNQNGYCGSHPNISRSLSPCCLPIAESGNQHSRTANKLKCSARYLAEQNSEIQDLILKPRCLVAGNSNCFRSFSCKVMTE